MTSMRTPMRASLKRSLAGAAFALGEVLFRNLLPVDKRERKAVGEEAEFFHQIKRERCPAGAQYMQEADLRIKPGCLDG